MALRCIATEVVVEDLLQVRWSSSPQTLQCDGESVLTVHVGLAHQHDKSPIQAYIVSVRAGASPKSIIIGRSSTDWTFEG